MWENLTNISKNKFGELYFCEGCESFHLVFKNLHFVLSAKQLELLSTHISKIDIDYWENNLCGTFVKRKIPVSTFQDNLILVFNKEEFKALKNLFFGCLNEETYLSAGDVDYKYVLN